jgi:hypothetical protein
MGRLKTHEERQRKIMAKKATKKGKSYPLAPAPIALPVTSTTQELVIKETK